VSTLDGVVAPEAAEGAAPLDKGLKQNAIGFVSSCVIGVASTAPGYSLAATLGFLALAVGVQTPAILLVAFIPMLLIAVAYYFLNRADPDCGTTFSWVTRALGPHLGWFGGWAIVVADIVVMANLAQIAGLYTFLLFGAEGAAASTFWVTFVGVIWIAIMTAVVTIGIELSARTQWFLLGAEYLILIAFAVVALSKVYTQDPANSIHPELAWFNPFEVSSFDALIAGVLLAIFIYWGWDSGVTVNEETEDSARAPGVAAVVSTLFLVFIYVLVATAAIAFAGVEALGENSDDALGFLGDAVFGSRLDKLLILAVLTSAAASTQTTILPTARTTRRVALQSVKNFVLVGLAPLTGAVILGYVFVKECIDLAEPANSESGNSWFGVGPPLVIAIVFGALGLVLMLFQWRANPEFFRRRPETPPDDILEEPQAAPA
jgi:amino acid transporter